MKEETKYLRFVNCTPQNNKTERWEVLSKSGGDFLAEIKWHGGWRQYCFFPTLAIFNSACLDDIKKFMDEMNKKQREK